MPINLNNIGIIVLAAGSSKRFNGDKRQALLPDGRTLLETSLSNVPESITNRILVLHPGDEELAAPYQKQWSIVIAEKSETGMAASLVAGISASINWPGTLIALGDMPFIKPETYLSVQTHLCNNDIVIPTVNNKSGHPVGIQQKYFAEILTLQGDEGARKVLRQHEKNCFKFNCSDDGIILDIDTPEALTQ